MRIGFIGDVHGQWRALQEEIDRGIERGIDMFIQVGDMGLYDPTKDKPTFDTRGRTFMFIDGNHDNVEALENGEFDLPENVHYVMRGTKVVFNLPGKDSLNVLFMGGGEGTVHWKKTEGKDYWPMIEVPSRAELEDFWESARGADMIITHAGPIQSPATRNDSDSWLVQAYGKILEDPEVNPRYWVFGHHHPKEPLLTRYRNTYLYCLPPVVVF